VGGVIGGVLAAAVGLGGIVLGVFLLAYITLTLSPFPIGILVPFAVAVGAAYFFLSFTRPYTAILFVIFTMPFEYLTVLFPADEYGQGGPLNFITLVKLMFGAIIVAGLLRMAITKQDRPFRMVWLTPIPALLLLFYGMCWMSLANAKRLGAFASNMISMGSGLVAFFILITLLSTRERMYRFLKVIFFAYIFISLMGLYEAFTQTHILKMLGFPMIERPWTTNPDAFRICGPSGDPDYYAISVIFGLMVTFAVLPLFKSLAARLAVLAMTLLHFLAIVATASRGAALSTALALAVFYLFARFRHKLLVGVLATATLAAGFGFFTVAVSSRAAARYTGAAGGDSSSFDERWGWIRMCWAMMMDAPVRGTGSGNFIGLYEGYRKNYPVPSKPESAQNTYAQLAAQNGIPTTLVYLAANLALWVVLFRVMRGTRDPTLRHVAVAWFALAVSFWLFSLTLDLVETEISWEIFASGVAVWSFHRQDLRRAAMLRAAGPLAAVGPPRWRAD
jgi:O-antigen ligase/polysaccharide polymerase Wzy-like membrane protein